MRFSLSYKTAAITMAVAAVSFAAPASAQNYNGYYQQPNNNNQFVGGAIGAVAGGVLGSQVAGNGARTEGSILGAVLGGVAGAAIAGNGNNRNVQRGFRQQPRQVFQQQGFYQQPVQIFQQPRVIYQNQGFYGQPVYPVQNFTTYRAPVVVGLGNRGFNRPFLGPRTGVTINIGNQGFGNRGFRNRGFNNRRFNNRRFNNRRFNNRRFRH